MKNESRNEHENPFARLERIFHEPNRTAIVSALCREGAAGVSFNALKAEFDLTDGNLSRHVKALEDAGAVRVEKTFVGSRPRTTIFVTEEGLEGFAAYLKALEEALKLAADSLPAERGTGAGLRLDRFAEQR